MSKLLELSDMFDVSKPIFKACKNSSGDIDFELVETYDPLSAPLNHSDPVVKLLVGNYRENFDRYNKVFQKNEMVNGVMRDIHNALRQAFLQASPLKNPIQSKLYKWYCQNMEYAIPEDGKLALFRYLSPHVGRDFRFNGGSDNPHAKNYVAIVEKMREKYERR